MIKIDEDQTTIHPVQEQQEEIEELRKLVNK